MNAVQKIMAPLTGVVLLGVLVIGVSIWMFDQTSTAADTREKTDLRIDVAKIALSELKDAETSQRGFLLTSNEDFLESYFAVKDTVLPKLAELLSLTQIDAARQRLVVLIELVDARLSHMAYLIELVQTNELALARQIVSSGEGRRLMDAVRSEMSAYIQIESAELARNEAQFQTSRNRLLATIIVASLLVALVVIYLLRNVDGYEEMNIEFRYSELVDMVEPIQDTIEAALLSGSAVDMDFLDSSEAGLPDEVLVSEEAHGISVIDGQIIATWMKDESDLDGVTYILTPKIEDGEVEWATTGTCDGKNAC